MMIETAAEIKSKPARVAKANRRGPILERARPVAEPGGGNFSLVKFFWFDL